MKNPLVNELACIHLYVYIYMCKTDTSVPGLQAGGVASPYLECAACREFKEAETRSP